jgi:hypothetical protein
VSREIPLTFLKLALVLNSGKVEMIDNSSFGFEISVEQNCEHLFAVDKFYAWTAFVQVYNEVGKANETRSKRQPERKTGSKNEYRQRENNKRESRGQLGEKSRVGKTNEKKVGETWENKEKVKNKVTKTHTNAIRRNKQK